MNVHFLLVCLLAYFAGSVPFGKIAGLIKGIDIQKKGSGNIGFANARRQLGWPIGIAVLLGDLLKGYLPALLAVHHFSTTGIMVVASLTLAGHLYPIWLKFKGGKGVATSIGFTIAINPVCGIIAAVIYLAAAAVLRSSAPSSLAAIWSLPVTFLVFKQAYFWYFFALAIVITWTHHENIRRLTWRYRLGPAQKP